MSQHSITVVIPVWNQWQMTKGCLETLRPTLGVRDQVVVVDNGSEDHTPAGLKQFPWAQIITNESNLGFAKACNQGAAAANGEIVVFLNNDTLLAPRWLEGLTDPFEDPTVAATGPRSNMVSGAQMVDEADYTNGSIADMKRFAKKWRSDHAGQVEEVERLVGFCLAVRKSAFDAIGGFDEQFETGGLEDDDLCVRLRQDGGRLLICHESFVHHHGHATFDANDVDWFSAQQDNLDRFRAKYHGSESAKIARVAPGQALVSACMIVKDEENDLAACLDSLNGVVDEVVIYDTGSTDRSVELARAAGAKVIEGFWDDDFSRARNAALDACSGLWALQIDADEVFDGDPLKLRDALLSTNLTAFQIDIENKSEGDRNNLTHRPCRVFRREVYEWKGRLHEQVTVRGGGARPEFGVISGIKLVHYGYLPEAMSAKKKAERNVRIAELDHEAGAGRDQVDSLTNLGRSYTLAGRHEDALALYTQARALPTDSDVAWRALHRAGAQAAMAVGRPEEALDWAEGYGAASKSQDTANYLRGMALTDLGRWQEALATMENLDKMSDDDGIVLPMYLVHIRRAAAHAGVEQWDRAADEITRVVTADSHDEPIWGLVIESYWRTNRDMSALFAEIPKDKLTAVLGQLVAAPPEAADAALEALYTQFSDRRPAVLALAIRVAPGLKVERALEWSARLREVGMAEHCPLIAIAWNGTVDAQRRITAAGAAQATFKDERAVGGLRFAATSLHPSRFRDTLSQLNNLSPDLLEPFVLAASSDGPRSLAMARALHALGAGEEAVAVVLHGVGPTSGSAVAAEAAEWLESVGRPSEAKGLRNQK